MRALLTLVLVAMVSVLTPAQIPRPSDLGNLARKIPSLDGFLKNRAIETTFDDTLGPQKFLDRRDIKRQPGDMNRLPRTSDGGFLLQPGLWEGTFDAFCLRPATWAPGAGDGYLWAPIKGGRANAISTILRGVVAHPDIPRGDVQLLLWAIISRTRVSEMPPKLQAAARALLPAAEINAINVNGLQVLAAADRTNLFRGVTGPIRQALDIEADLRYQFSRGNANYEQIEKIAVLSGAPPPQSKDAVNRGQWSRHPGGYHVRYFPVSYPRMRLQVLVPARVNIVRDQLHRIVSVEDSRGRKVETTYNDAVAPRPHPRNARLKAYAFKTVRITRRGAAGKPEVLEIKDKGYTFHQSRPRQRRGIVAILIDSARGAFTFVTGTPLQARQDWEGWAERTERAHEAYEDGEYIRERADAATTTGDASSVDDAADSEHYEDGIEAATTGDTSDRFEWIGAMHELFNEMLEYATSVIDSAPTTSTTGDTPRWDPGGGVAVPSGYGSQTVGSSSRFH
jgi:hypothetical protein